MSRAPRFPLLALGALGLAWGVWLGLQRLGAAPVIAPRALGDHGPLMVSGFLGTVIALERAVAAGRRWAYLGPLGCAASVLLTVLGRPGEGAWAALCGSAIVVAVLAAVALSDRALHHVALVVAALCWVAGSAVVVLGRPVFDAVPWWLAFLVGTICAERLELSRLLPRAPSAHVTFVIALALLVAGAAVSLLERQLGLKLLGAAELAFAAWLWRHDLARRTVRQQGQVRFIAACLLSGYAWLAVSGALAVWLGNPLAGSRYDAVLHAALVGFVFSMIFGHALVIVPAVLGVRIAYRPRFYAHLALLHGSLAARLLGDLLDATALRRWGAWLNAAALLLFLVSTVTAAQRARPAERARGGPAADTPAPRPAG